MKPKLTKSEAMAQWESAAKALLVSEMRQRKMGYKELSLLLEKVGIDELPDQINRKVNRKRFSGAFLLACLAAMDIASIQVPKISLQQKEG